MAEINFNKQDLTYLEWSKIRHSSGTAGSFLKSYESVNGKKIYYKLSDFDSLNGIVGHECVNEIITDRLLNILGIDHLKYTLIRADIMLNGQTHETYLCASDDFKQKGEEKSAFDIYYSQNKDENESPLEFCRRNGFEKYIYEMTLVDFLILNRDRHGANIEILRNPKKKSIRFAPLFDHGFSLLSRCRTDEDFRKFDVIEDKKIQSFIGSNSAYENLGIIPADGLSHINKLKKTDRDYIMSDIDMILSSVATDKIWEMIWQRWCLYEDFCNKKR